MKTALLLKEIQSQKSKDSGTASFSERSRSNSIHSADSFADMSLLLHEMQKPRSSSLGSKVNTTTTSNTKNHTRSHPVCLSSEDDEQHYHQSSPISIKPRSPSRSRSGSMVVVAEDTSHLTRISELESIIRSDSDVSVHRLEKPKFSISRLWSSVCTRLLHAGKAVKQ